jgi:hypothetical protein
MRIEDKLTILAAAAKYDASCASSGSRRRNSGRKLGHSAPWGICHSYTEASLRRLYGFSMDEVISQTSPWLDLEIDPKQAFARRHPQLFQVDINPADREMILRVPGIGLKTANRIVGLRKKGRLRFEHLKQLGAVASRAQPFIRCDGMETTRWAGSVPLRRPHLPRTVGSPEGLTSAATPFRRTVFETDGSFEGRLTAIFRAYATSLLPDAIVSVNGGRYLTEKIPKGGCHECFSDPRFGQSPPGDHPPGPAADGCSRHDHSRGAVRQALRPHARWKGLH